MYLVEVKEPSEILAGYCQLIRAVGWEPRDQERMHEALGRSLAVIAAYDGSRLVGAARLVGDGVYNLLVYDMVVHPDFQRRGVGKALLSHCERYAERLGVPRLECICAEGSISFYHNLKWTPTPAFYRELGC